MPKTKITYDEWMKAVDRQVQLRSGGELGEQDLPDWDSREMYEEGISPSKAAQHAISEAGGF